MNKEKTKICNKCKKEQSMNLFCKDKTKKDGLHTICKTCKQKTRKEYYQKNRVKILEHDRNYRLKNKEKRNQQSREYYQKNRERLLECNKKYQQENKDAIRQRKKKYREKNKEKIRQRKKKSWQKYRKKRLKHAKEYYNLNKKRIMENARIYIVNRYQTDINFRLKMLLRWRVRSLLKGKNKSKSTMDLLGCDIEAFKKHLEKQFTKEMSWKEVMNGKIHIDHIIPCNTFDLTKPEEQKKCFHYSNLRPLWAKDNISRPKDGSDIKK